MSRFPHARASSTPTAKPFVTTLGLALTLVLAACAPDVNGGPTRPDGTPRPGQTSDVVDPGGESGDAEPGVIKGRVTTAHGVPVADAEIRVVGVIGGGNLGTEIETLRTGSDGGYRMEVPSGLYVLTGVGGLSFDGQTYLYELDPADGTCDQESSDSGIVEDFVLRLTGPLSCDPGQDLDSNASYHGASIQLFDTLEDGSSDGDVIEFTLEPLTPLADGSAGETLTMTRTVGALSTSYGPIDSTWVLYDIPLARYRVSATITSAGGSPRPVLVSTADAPDPAASVEVVFPSMAASGLSITGSRVTSLWVSSGS